MSDSGQAAYTPNGVRKLSSDRSDGCGHDGCDDPGVWEVEYIVESDDAIGYSRVGYCDGHVKDYYGYYPPDYHDYSTTDSSREADR